MRKALLIGIDDYPFGYDLHGCVNDVNSLEPLLKRNGDGSKLFDVKTLRNLQSSSKAMEEITELFSGDEDVALLYFSGHGCDNGNGVEIVFPDDIKSETTHSTGIKLDEILTVANKSKVRNKVFILDSCYSGAMGEGSPSRKDSSLYPGVTILSACRNDQTAMELGNHGAFTTRLCQALEGEAATVDGTITLGGIYAYVDSMFGSWEQRPVFKTNVSQFVAFRKVKPRVDINIIRLITTYFEEPDVEYKLDPSYEFTNTEDHKDRYKLIEPLGIPEHIEILKNLQKLESIGLIEPVGEEHMYFAVMRSKSCRLTLLGKHFWNLIHNDRI